MFPERLIETERGDGAGLFRLIGIGRNQNFDRIADSEPKVGRPCDALTPALGPRLLDLFLRYNTKAGRHSVLTSIDGRLVQKEAGHFFAYVKAVIEPINDYLVRELNWKPVSAGRLARYALKERRRRLLAMQLRAAKRHRMAEHDARL